MVRFGLDLKIEAAGLYVYKQKAHPSGYLLVNYYILI